MYRPDVLRADSVLAMHLPDGGFVHVPKTSPTFKAWRGAEVKDTFNGKAVLDYCGVPLFAEELTLRALQAAGWTGVWVNSYRREYINSYHPRERIALPADRQDLLARIAGSSAFPSGCWDVFAWRDNHILFAECKRATKDKIRLTQQLWLEKALAIGLAIEDFLIVDWTLIE